MFKFFLCNYFRNQNNNDRLLIFILAFVLQMVALNHLLLLYEADSAGFLEIANSYLQLSPNFSSYRPPMFSLLLIFTGVPWLESFYGIIFLHCILGILSPLLVYEMLLPINRTLSLFTSFILCGSWITFLNVKTITADQVLLFNIIFTYFIFSRFIFTRNKKFIYLTAVSGLAAMFTRWEGAFVLVSAMLGITLYVLRPYTSCVKSSHPSYTNKWLRKLNLKHLFGSYLIILSVVSFYSLSRCYYFRDFSLFGKLQEGSDQQLFWRVTTDLSYYTSAWKNLLGPRWTTSLMPADNILASSQGPYAQEVRGLIFKALHERPENFKEFPIYEAAIGSDSSKPVEELRYKLFGRFTNNPSGFVEYLFSKDTIIDPHYSQYYTFLISILLGQNVSGTKYRNIVGGWAKEIMVKNHWMYLEILRAALAAFGVPLENIIQFLLNNSDAQTTLFKNIKDHCNIWSNYCGFHINYDIANYASRTLSAKFFSEYKKEYEQFDIRKHRAHLFHKTVSLMRNSVRNILGPIFLLFGVGIFFSRWKVFYLSILLGLFGVVGVISFVGEGPANNKYEGSTLPLIIILSTCTIFTIVLYVKNHIRPLFRS